MASCIPRELGAYAHAVDAATGKQLWFFDPQAIRARPEIPAAISSIAASPYGRVRSSSPRSTATCTRSTPRPASRFGTRHNHRPRTEPIPAQGQSTWRVISPSSATAAPTWIKVAYAATSRLTTSETGTLKWRLFTGARRALDSLTRILRWRLADKTWDPHRAADYKGGGTVRDGFAYDPDLEAGLFRHRQCGSVRSATARPAQRRRPIRGIDSCGARGKRQPRLVFPDHSGRPLGLRRRGRS